jgi:hypothetical protein
MNSFEIMTSTYTLGTLGSVASLLAGKPLVSIVTVGKIQYSYW